MLSAWLAEDIHATQIAANPFGALQDGRAPEEAAKAPPR
jgi:hypothetical protein